MFKKDILYFRVPDRDDNFWERNKLSRVLDLSEHQDFISEVENRQLGERPLVAEDNDMFVCDGGRLSIEVPQGDRVEEIYEGPNCSSAEKLRENHSDAEAIFARFFANFYLF